MSNTSEEQSREENSGESVPVELKSFVNLTREKSPENSLDTLARELLELKLDYVSETNHRSQEIERLRFQFNWMSGILFLVITVVSATMTWIVYGFKPQAVETNLPEQNTLVTQLEEQNYQNLAEEIESWQEKLAAESEKIQINQDKIAEIEQEVAQIQQLEGQMQTLENQLNSHQQEITALVQSLEALIQSPTNSTPETTPNTEESTN